MNYLKRFNVRKALMMVSIALMMTTIGSCKKKGGMRPDIGCENINKEVDKYFAVLTEFSENQTSANCEKVKKAGLAYIKAVEKCARWYPGVVKEAKEAVKEIENWDCSEYN